MNSPGNLSLGPGTIAALGNVLAVWKSSGGAGSTSLVEAARNAVGHRAKVAYLHVDQHRAQDIPNPRLAVRSAAPSIADATMAAARALAPLHDLVIVEIEGAHRGDPETNAELLAVARLAEAGAVTALIAESRSTHSLAVGLSRLLTVVTVAPPTDPSRHAVVLNNVTDDMGTSLLRVEEHLVNIGVPNVHIAGRGDTGWRRANRNVQTVAVGTSLQAVAYDILSDMNLPCLRVTDTTIDGLLGDGGSRRGLWSRGRSDDARRNA